MRKAPKSNNNNKKLTKQRCCVLCRCCCCCLPVRDGQRKLPTTAERALYSFAVTRAFLSLSPCAHLVATQTNVKCVLANASTFFIYSFLCLTRVISHFFVFTSCCFILLTCCSTSSALLFCVCPPAGSKHKSNVICELVFQFQTLN